MITQVSVIGPGSDLCTPDLYEFARSLGKILADRELVIICGGRGGVMEAVCAGAKESARYKKFTTIGILPGLEKNDANSYCDVVIPTGLNLARNQLVINSGDVIIALGGGAGTLSELAFAWQFGKKVICYITEPGWASKLAGKSIDSRHEDLLIPVDSLEGIVNQLAQLML